MPPRIEDYQGREQSFIKHLFLNKYLESAAYKLFQGRSPVFNAAWWREHQAALRLLDPADLRQVIALKDHRRQLLEAASIPLQPPARHSRLI